MKTSHASLVVVNGRVPTKPATPSAEAAAIGARLRARRAELGLTLANAAGAAGITAGFLSEVERDRASPSIDTLMRLCGVLDIAIGSLFETRQPTVIRLADRRSMRFEENGCIYELLGAPVGSRLIPIYGVLLPGALSSEAFEALDFEEQFLTVLEGRMIVEFDRSSIELCAGDSASFDPHVPHRYRNPSQDDPAVAICVTRR